MRVVSIRGKSDSGKTETALALVRELRRRGHSVLVAKDVHVAGFSLDTPGKDSARLGEASGLGVVVRAPTETALLFRRRLSLAEIAEHLEADYVVLEGFRDAGCPNIACAHDEAGLAGEVDGRTIAVSGRVADGLPGYRGLPAASALAEPGRLADLVEAGASPLSAADGPD